MSLCENRKTQRLISEVVGSGADYTAFGEEISSGTGLRTSGQGFGASDSLRQRYGLTERDEATGLDHTWFRKHENQAGRWTSPDPYNGSMNLGDPQSFNRYAYVENQPTNFVDPSGLMVVAFTMTVCLPWDGGPHICAEILIHLMDTGGGGEGGGGEGGGGRGGVEHTGGGGNCDDLIPNGPAGESVLANIRTTQNKINALKEQAQKDATNVSIRGEPLSAAAAVAVTGGIDTPGGPLDNWFYKIVVQGGAWDYKKDNSAFEAFGNFNYGAVGAAAGYPLGVLERMAGWVQTSESGQKPEGTKAPTMAHARLGVGGTWPYGDELHDNAQIRSGYAYYNCLRGEGRV